VRSAKSRRGLSGSGIRRGESERDGATESETETGPKKGHESEKVGLIVTKKRGVIENIGGTKRTGGT